MFKCCFTQSIALRSGETSFLSGEAIKNFPSPNVFLLHSVCNLEFKYNPNKSISHYSVTVCDWKQWHCHTIVKNSPCPSSLNTSSLFSDSFSFLPRRLFLPPLPKLKMGEVKSMCTVCRYKKWKKIRFMEIFMLVLSTAILNILPRSRFFAYF